MVIEADCKGRVGEGNSGDDVMGVSGMGGRIAEGQMIVPFSIRMVMVVVNPLC